MLNKASAEELAKQERIQKQCMLKATWLREKL
jgi:hypothetical protein